MERKELTIGLFGFGCVGYGLYEVLQKTPALNAGIKTICVKDRTKKRPLPAGHFTFDKNKILDDETVNVVVELTDDADAAFEIVSDALKRGKAVVTANKKMIAEHFTELLALQKKHHAPLLYEGACCASIPVIRNLEEYYDTDLLESLKGIVNGSTNYILTRVLRENASYESALLEAQQKGYAESDPRMDTEGFDAKYKLVILLAHAFGLVVEPDRLLSLGIDRIGTLETAYAREKGYKIKLTALAERRNGAITAFVMPEFIGPWDHLYHVDDVFNGIRTKSAFSDTQFFSGKGAGAHPTASAVLSDISALTYGYRYEYKKQNHDERLEAEDEVYLKVMLAHGAGEDVLLRPQFSTVTESYVNENGGYIIGTLSLRTVRNIHDGWEKCSFIFFEMAGSPPVRLYSRNERQAMAEKLI